ncbi:SRPBCC family protein [Microbacterium sp. P02]|uniref:SRPBCC family protein n=1 Tax=Microbacterium sp. P02 TaxID=3366260 RepID=UPI00366CCB65
MSRNVRVVECSPEDVFRVLDDGWLFPSWVVGASRMRHVEKAWPNVGSRLHHSFGVWPALIDDATVIEEYDPPRLIVMRAKGWPIGEALITINVKPRGLGSAVRLQEEPLAGPARYVPQTLMDALLHWRNRETLHRLAYLAEGLSEHRSDVTSAERELQTEWASAS